MFFGPPASGSASTPQKTLQSFVAAYNRRDRRSLATLVQNGKNAPVIDAALNEDKETTFSVSNIRVKPNSGIRVTVVYQLIEIRKGRKPEKPVQGQIEMVKVSGNWLVVAPKPDGITNYSNLAAIAIILVNPSLLNKPVKAKTESAESKLKQIATGTMKYIIDYDDKIQLKPEDYYKSIDPYIRDKKVFTSPLDKPGTISFSFNGNLSGRMQESINEPDKVILFYEGKPGSLKFRYGGKALVALADGSVRYFTPDEAKRLLWK